MQILIDTNILLRGAEPDHKQHSVASSAVHALQQAQHELCLVPQVHYEFWVVLTRPVSSNGLGYTPTEAELELKKLEAPLFRVLRDERAIYGNWRYLVNKYAIQGKNAHDARLVAAMMRHGVKHLLTFNAADFSRFEEIEVIMPEQAIAKA
jgi:predicted nucleic acid-binding protein